MANIQESVAAKRSQKNNHRQEIDDSAQREDKPTVRRSTRNHQQPSRLSNNDTPGEKDHAELIEEEFARDALILSHQKAENERKSQRRESSQYQPNVHKSARNLFYRRINCHESSFERGVKTRNLPIARHLNAANLTSYSKHC
ncbi:hypothetical protein ACMFMG_008708 [Clarireedia jacksonii]